MCATLIQSCLTLCEPMDYNLQGSSTHGISKARILEWVAISFSRGLFRQSPTGIKPTSSALAVGSLPLSHEGSPIEVLESLKNFIKNVFFHQKKL